MAELEEELETLKSIFMDDVTCGGEEEEEGGARGRVMTLTMEGQNVLTLRIPGVLWGIAS